MSRILCEQWWAITQPGSTDGYPSVVARLGRRKQKLIVKYLSDEHRASLTKWRSWAWYYRRGWRCVKVYVYEEEREVPKLQCSWCEKEFDPGDIHRIICKKCHLLDGDPW